MRVYPMCTVHGAAYALTIIEVLKDLKLDQMMTKPYSYTRRLCNIELKDIFVTKQRTCRVE